MDPAPAAALLLPHHPWRRRLLLASALVGVAALALMAGHWLRMQSALRTMEIQAFDLDAAMDLAGTVVPPETQSFYFFVLEPDAAGEIDELADKLVQAAGEHEFVGITGADAVHNREVLVAALAIVRGRDLAGLIVIYLGPPEHEAELKSLVAATGAQLRFVSYQPLAAETI